MVRDPQDAADIQVAAGDIDIVVGTVALLQQDIAFKSLGLVVIDEQHKFGVEQRGQLRKQDSAHCLVMTATPIPRTLAMTAFGDLDCSIIRHAPPGRGTVVRVGRVLASRTKAVTTDCTLIGGDSGGPLLDFDAKVIGADVAMSRAYGGPPACLVIEDGIAYALHRGVRLELPDDTGDDLTSYLQRAAALEPEGSMLKRRVAERVEATPTPEPAPVP